MNAKDAIYACDDFDVDLKGKRRWDEPEITHPEKRQKYDDILQRQGEDHAFQPGKLESNWEDLYKVISCNHPSRYHLETLE